MKKFTASAVICDLDGTLVHTGPDLAAATNRMLADLGMEQHPENTILAWIGNGAPRLIKRALTASRNGEPDPVLFTRAQSLFKQHYLAGVCDASQPYPAVIQTLRLLEQRGFELACVTNKPEAFTTPLLRKLELDHYFRLVVSGDSLAKKKPDPLPLLHICAELEIGVSQAAMVGDSVNDIEAAQAAGMPVICVSYGYNQGMDLTNSSPDAIIQSFSGLPHLLELH